MSATVLVCGRCSTALGRASNKPGWPFEKLSLESLASFVCKDITVHGKRDEVKEFQH